MKTALKVFLIVIGVVIALVIAAAVILPLVFNPNDYKDQIAQIVQQRTGRELRIPGNIELSVVPWLGVDLGKVELSNAKGFGDEPFASIEHAAVHIRIWPLLHKKIQLGKLTLDGLTLRLARDKQGHNNWSDIARKMSAGSNQAPAKPAPQPSPGKKSGGFQLTSFQVAGVQVQHAQIFWDDATSDTHYRLQKFNLRTGAVELGKPFMLNSSFDLHANRPQVDAEVELVGKVNADVANKRYSLNALRVTVDANGSGVPGGKQELTLTGDAKADLGAQTAALQNIELKGVGLDAKAQMTGKKIVDAPQFTGSLKVDEFSPRAVMKKLQMTVPETSDADVLTKASLSSNFSGTADRVSLNDLNMKLDDSHLTGKASVTHFSAPAIRFDLAVNQLDADRYLPPSAKPEQAGEAVKNGQTKNPEGGESDVNKTPIPLDSLKGLNVAGTLRVGKLKAMNLKMQNAEVKIDLNKGVLKVNPLAAQLYGGKLQSSATVSSSGNQSYALKADVSGIKAGPLLKDLTRKKALIDGQGQLKLDVHSSGKTVGAARSALAGNGNFAFNNGAINGFNLAQIVRTAKAKLTGGSAAQSDVPQKTDFTALTGSMKIAKGILTNNDLNMKSPLFRVDGKGTVNLVKNALDYEVKVAVVNTLSGQGGAGLADLKGVTVPVRLSGNLFSPHYRVDVVGALRSVQSERLDKAKEKLQDKRQKEEKKLRGKLKDKLNNFLH